MRIRLRSASCVLEWETSLGSRKTTTKLCMASRRAPASLESTRIDLLILHQPLPSAFERTLEAYRALIRTTEGPTAADRHETRVAFFREESTQHSQRRALRRPQRTAFFTSAVILASSVAVSSLSAY